MPPLCLLTFCFPLIPIIICTCASFPLIVFKPFVFLSPLLCVCMLAPSPSILLTLVDPGGRSCGILFFVLVYLFLSIFWGFLCYTYHLVDLPFLSWRITFVLVEFLLRLWSYMCSWRTSLFTTLNTPSQVLLCLPHLLGSADYSWLSWLSDCFSSGDPGS